MALEDKAKNTRRAQRRPQESEVALGAATLHFGEPELDLVRRTPAYRPVKEAYEEMAEVGRATHGVQRVEGEAEEAAA